MMDWTPFEFLIGNWAGRGEGQAGVSTVERSYEFVLNRKFIYVRNKSIYLPQNVNPKGETHEDWGFISFDKTRQVFVLRQFHVEGFVNQYLLPAADAAAGKLVFVTEAIENIPAGLRARETYTSLAPAEFSEHFELAAPEQDFETYTLNHLQCLA